MRAIETKESKERAEAKKRKVISLVLLIIMVLSTAGYALIVYQGNSSNGQSGDSGEQNPLNQNLNLLNSKEETKNVQTEISFRLADYSGKNIYLDSDISAANYEITSTIGRYTEKIQEACYGKCQRNLPEKNCSSMIIVVNSTAEKNLVRQEDNCIFIEGDLKAVDAFIYKVFEG